VLLVVLRLVQGLGVGGEWGGAVLMSTEYAPKGRRGLFGAFVQMGVPAGLLTSTLVLLAVSSSMSDEAFLSYGWRIPFLLSIVLVAVGLYIRLRILESPAFEHVKEEGGEAKIPLVETFRNHPKAILTALGARVGENGLFYLFTVFILEYGESELGFERTELLVAVIIAASIGLLTTPFFGALSDRLGRRPVYLFGAVVSLLFSFAYIPMLDTKSIPIIILATIIGLNLGHDAMYGPQAAFFAESFGVRSRYTGASIGYQLAGVFGGGIAPLVATALLATGDMGTTYIAFYMAFLCAITVVSVLVATETYQTDIDQDVGQDRSRGAASRGRRPASTRRTAARRFPGPRMRRRYSSTTSVSPSPTDCPSRQRISRTTPGLSASTGSSIFMDSMMTSASPSSTSWPTSHSIRQIVPVIWATTSANPISPVDDDATARVTARHGEPR